MKNILSWVVPFWKIKWYIWNINFFKIQISVPEENVATTKHGATVILGEAKQALLDGDTTNYDMERGIYILISRKKTYLFLKNCDF